MRAVSLGRALGDKDLLKVFRVAQQVGVDRIVARVVNRDAVHRQADLIRVHPAHGVVDTAQAAGVIAVDVHSRRIFQHVDSVAGAGGFFHRLFGQGGTRFAAVFLHHQTAAERLPLNVNLPHVAAFRRQRGPR